MPSASAPARNRRRAFSPGMLGASSATNLSSLGAKPFVPLAASRPLPLMEDMEFSRPPAPCGKSGGARSAGGLLGSAASASRIMAHLHRERPLHSPLQRWILAGPAASLVLPRTALSRLTIQSSPRSRSKNSAGVEASRSDWRVVSWLSRRASEPTQIR